MFLSSNPKIEWLADTRAALLEDVIYKDGEVVYVVPKGYVTDGASVPRSLSWIYPKFGTYLQAAILHDWLITDLLPTGEISSSRVDELFKEAMATLDIPKVRQLVMWAGVRLGAIGNKKRRKGSLKTLPKVVLVLLLTSPYTLPPSLVVQLWLGAAAFFSLFVPKRQKITAQKT
jgi:hypothetical protein